MAWLDEGHGSAHGLNADLCIVDWLCEQGIGFDVMADEDLRHEGRGILDPYNVVLTGTRPEYWSLAMIRSAQDYLQSGGRTMYRAAMGCIGSDSWTPRQGRA